MDDIERAFPVGATQDAAYGVGARLELGSGEQHKSVELFPASGVVRITRANSRHEYFRVSELRVAQGGVLFSSADHDDIGFVSPTHLLFATHAELAAHRLTPQPAPPNADEAAQPALPSPALPADSPTPAAVVPASPQMDRHDVRRRPEAEKLVTISGSITSRPEFYTAPSKKGGKETRAKFAVAEVVDGGDDRHFEVVAGRGQAESIRRRGLTVGDQVSLKGFRHFEPLAPNGKEVGSIKEWFWAVAVHRLAPEEQT